MTYEDRKKQKSRRKIRNLIVTGIFILLVAKSAYGIIEKNPKTILPKEERYIVSMKADSVIIKDESVYDINGSLELNPNIQEGKRLSQGFELGKSSIIKDIHSLNDELEEINAAIDLLSNKNTGSDLFSSDKEELEISQEDLVKEIQTKIMNKDYSSIGELKNKILFYEGKLKDVSMDDTLLAQSLESLNSRKEAIISEINNNSITYYTQKSGVISFKIDGYEKIYVPQEFENYTYENFQILETDEENDTKNENESYKIINNFEWYLAIKIDKIKEMESYGIGDIINLKIGDNDRELVGKIIQINENNGKGVYIVQFNSYLFDYYQLRFASVEILLSKQDAYLIPTKSIINYNGQKGVYIKEFNGIIRFRPIKILGEKDDYTYISKGDINRYIDLDLENPIKTISLYDQIIVSPWNFNEGDIIN